MSRLIARPSIPKPPKPVFTPTPSPAALAPSMPQEGTANVGSEDSRMGTVGTESLIRHTSRKSSVGGKRTFLGG